ncbi:hypothetical protein L2E82_18160 [Cichorium intybus]|uniref:Uncharacterized protein n=1 Tax=Cichorium intybus TaxID=13427 RepID=A0ACB9F9E1_CICIN|nr:hypothetical protein L2E82_18160 [Cichorium intybus]
MSSLRQLELEVWAKESEAAGLKASLTTLMSEVQRLNMLCEERKEAKDSLKKKWKKIEEFDARRLELKSIYSALLRAIMDAGAFWSQQPLAAREFASSTIIPECKVVIEISNGAKDLIDQEVSSLYRSPDNTLYMLPSTPQALLESMGPTGSTGLDAEKKCCPFDCPGRCPRSFCNSFHLSCFCCPSVSCRVGRFGFRIGIGVGIDGILFEVAWFGGLGYIALANLMFRMFMQFHNFMEFEYLPLMSPSQHHKESAARFVERFEYLPLMSPSQHHKESAARFVERTGRAMASALNFVQAYHSFADYALLLKAVESGHESFVGLGV